jgi:histidine triad (HIT) family protein
MEDSIFTRIIKGEIPCHKIYEDEQTLAFLDIHPVQPGHALVISKKQIDHLWDLEDVDYRAVMETSRRVAQRIHKVLLPERVGVQVLGIDIPHAHVHLIPFSTAAQFRAVPDMSAEPDHTALAEMAKRLQF